MGLRRLAPRRHGCQLSTDQGPVTLTWTATFYPYGVKVFHDPITDHLVLGEDGPQRVGPDDNDPGVWEPYLGSPIHGGIFNWERLEIGPSRRADGTIVGAAYTVDVPIALRVDFQAGAVWFVAAIPQFPQMQGGPLCPRSTFGKSRRLGSRRVRSAAKSVHLIKADYDPPFRTMN
jgi:hypothetical protein